MRPEIENLKARVFMSGLTRDQKGLAIEELKALLDYIQELEQKLQHGVSGKWLYDKLTQAIATQTQIIENLVSGKRVVNLDEAIVYYKSLHAVCASGAVDTVAEGRECRQSVMCDVWNTTGYCSCCGGITLRGISDEGQP